MQSQAVFISCLYYYYLPLPPNVHNPQQQPPGQPPAGLEQSLLLIRDNWVKPLEVIIERQAGQLEALALELGEVRARVKQLEAEQLALEAAVEPSQAAEVNIPAVVVETPAAAQQAQKRPSLWTRMFGGGR